MPILEENSLQMYANTALGKFTHWEKQLGQIQEEIIRKRDTKTTKRIVGSMFGTLGWLIVFGAAYWFTRPYVEYRLGLGCLGIAVALIIAMLISEVIELRYYGKLSSYICLIDYMIQNVGKSKAAINRSLNEFTGTRHVKGWKHALSPRISSIPGTVAEIKDQVNQMGQIKSGFISGLKNVLFFALVIAITGVAGWSLFGLVEKIFRDNIDANTLRTLCIIALIIAEVGTIVLAKLWWSHTDCMVNNVTMFVVLLGAATFALVVAAAALVVSLVYLAIGVASVAVVIGIVAISTAGG